MSDHIPNDPVAEIRAWLKSDAGKKFACVRDGYYRPPEAGCVGCMLKAAVAEIEAQRTAVESLVKIAEEAFTEWDSDNDPRVGKILLALSGEVPGYRADIDAMHALRRRFVVAPQAALKEVAP